MEVTAVDLFLEQEELRFLELLRDKLSLDRLTTAAIEVAARARHRWPSWEPARSPSGKAVLFHGWLDNCTVLAAELGIIAGDKVQWTTK